MLKDSFPGIMNVTIENNKDWKQQLTMHDSFKLKVIQAKQEYDELKAAELLIKQKAELRKQPAIHDSLRNIIINKSINYTKLQGELEKQQIISKAAAYLKIFK